jgi:hypothetical protein
MAPYDNLPNFRRWLENKIGHTSKSRNDMLILGDYVRYKLEEEPTAEVANFVIEYRSQQWKAALVITPLPPRAAVLEDEIVVELTDDAISSVIAQCAFNEGSVLNERERQRKANPHNAEARTTGRK